MRRILQNHDTSDLVDQYLSGEIQLDEAVDEAIQPWMSAVQHKRMKLSHQ